MLHKYLFFSQSKQWVVHITAKYTICNLYSDHEHYKVLGSSKYRILHLSQVSWIFCDYWSLHRLYIGLRKCPTDFQDLCCKTKHLCPLIVLGLLRDVRIYPHHLVGSCKCLSMAAESRFSLLCVTSRTHLIKHLKIYCRTRCPIEKQTLYLQ